MLARISHQASAAAADPLAVAGRTPSRRFDVVTTTPAASLSPCDPPQRRLDALATKPGEKCGLSLTSPVRSRAARSLLLLSLAPAAVHAGQPPTEGPPATGQTDSRPTRIIDAPAPPVAPAVINRDAEGRATVRAVRVAQPLVLDGRLDDAVYADVPPLSDFLQQEPREGEPATERTEVWVLFDDENVYFSFRCWETDPDRLIANEMRRDNVNVYQNDHIAWVIDPFYDRRNGLEFLVNPLGGRMDGQITSERFYNEDWNPIWDVAVGTFDGGWTVETAVPFKSIRYQPGRSQLWGFNVRRVNFAKNEHSFLTPVPRSLGDAAIFQMSRHAALVGIEAPAATTHLDIKPYAIMDVTSDHLAMPRISNDAGGSGGIDVKYGVTQNLVADLTVNTDFAHVEADEQQVNLTRFSLFFPEKREFFVENQGLFAFGGAGAGPFGGGGSTPVLFYSRRIGLAAGDDGAPVEVPIHAGGRLTGRVGRFTLGALNMQTGDAPNAAAQATNFTVVRIKRDVLRRSSIGGIFTGRAMTRAGGARHATYGLDGTFSFFDDLTVNTYWAQTRAPERGEDDVSYRAQLDYNGDRYGVQMERLTVGDDFSPEVGFLQREDFDRSFGLLRFSPRPHAIAAIRKLIWEGSFDYFTNRSGVLETRIAQGRFAVQFENGDQFDTAYTRSYEFLERPFEIASGVAIPVGGHPFQDVDVSYSLAQQRALGGTIGVQHGSFYNGRKTTLRFGSRGFGVGRFELSQQLSVEPGFEVNRISLPQAEFTTQLVTARTTYTFTPLMFVSALLQYNSTNNSVGANVRLRWEYQPGSELFIVYNEQRNTLSPRFPLLENRAFIIKFNRLFRF